MIKRSEYGEIFRRVVPGANVMTPKVLGYFLSGHYICELSTGTDFNGNDIFGVTIVNATTEEHDHDKSKLCHSRREVQKYMLSLGKLSAYEQ